jgi:glycosyltransferase involved in cell wall biosynthesis
VKVLFLHQHFKTPDKGGALRSYYLAKALVDAGITVVVLTAHNHKHLKREFVDGIEVHSLPISYNNRFGFYKRGYAFMRFVWAAIKHARHHTDALLCYAISVPLTVGIAALRIQKENKIPYVFEVGDLWPDAPIQLGFINNVVLRKSLLKLEKSIYKSAKSVVALSPSIESAIREKVPGKKTIIIPNMSDTEFFQPTKKKSEWEKKFNVEGKFVISYIGAIGYANGLEYFLECARESQRAKLPIQFILCGEGAMLENLKSSATKLSLQNLLILPFTNRDGVAEIMNVTDATFICYKPFPVLETGSPNKFFDGLAAGKLTIVNFKGWIKDEIEKEGCGVYVDTMRPDDFPRIVEPFLKNPGWLHKYQQAARALAEKKYSRRILSEKFYNFITSSASES